VVVMIDNSVTNGQSTPTTMQAVVNNDPLQLVDSLTKAQLDEQNRQLCMEIVNNNPLTAEIQANATIGPQPESILSVSKPPMSDLLSSASIVPNVNPAWNIEPNNSTNMVVSTSIHLMNVANEHNNVVLDSNI